jgi:hypothetical protein
MITHTQHQLATTVLDLTKEPEYDVVAQKSLQFEVAPDSFALVNDEYIIVQYKAKKMIEVFSLMTSLPHY